MTEILAPRVYTSRDPGAPVLSAADRISLIDVLEKVLVDGYGTGLDLKESLGWGVFKSVSGNRAVFMPGPGSKDIGLVVYSDVVVSLTRFIQTRGVIGFGGWSGEELTSSPTLFGLGHFHKSLYTTGEVAWCIIGTSRSFYMWTGWDGADTGQDFNIACFSGVHDGPSVDNTSYRRPPFFFGDLGGAKNHPYATLIAQSADTNASSAWNVYASLLGHPTSAVVTQTPASIAATANGLSTGLSAVLRVNGTIPASGAGGAQAGFMQHPAYPPIGDVWLDPVMCFEVSKYQDFYGQVPGWYLPRVNLIDFDAPHFKPLDTFQDGNNSFWVMPSAMASTAAAANRNRGLYLLSQDPWYS